MTVSGGGPLGSAQVMKVETSGMRSVPYTYVKKTPQSSSALACEDTGRSPQSAATEGLPPQPDLTGILVVDLQLPEL